MGSSGPILDQADPFNISKLTRLIQQLVALSKKKLCIVQSIYFPKLLMYDSSCCCSLLDQFASLNFSIISVPSSTSNLCIVLEDQTLKWIIVGCLSSCIIIYQKGFPITGIVPLARVSIGTQEMSLCLLHWSFTSIVARRWISSVSIYWSSHWVLWRWQFYLVVCDMFWVESWKGLKKGKRKEGKGTESHLHN